MTQMIQQNHKMSSPCLTCLTSALLALAGARFDKRTDECPFFPDRMAFWTRITCSLQPR